MEKIYKVILQSEGEAVVILEVAENSAEAIKKGLCTICNTQGVGKGRFKYYPQTQEMKAWEIVEGVEKECGGKVTVEEVQEEMDGSLTLVDYDDSEKYLNRQ